MFSSWNSELKNQDPGLHGEIVQQPNSDNCLIRLNFVAPHREKVIFALEENYITSAIKKIHVVHAKPGSFQNIGL